MAVRKELKLIIPKEQNPYYRDNPEYFDELLELVQSYPCHYHKKIMSLGVKKYAKSYLYLREWIDASLPLLNSQYSYSTKCFWILNGLTEFPKCTVCSKTIDVSGIRLRLSDKYPVTCGSKDCKYSLTMKTMAQTKTELYGDPFYHNVDKQKVTVQELVRNDLDFWKKREAKSKATKVLNGHDENWNNQEKAGETNMKLYGSKTFLGSEEFRRNYRTFEKLAKCAAKAIETRRRHKTFNTSKPEARVIGAFKAVFGADDVLTNWNGDSRYPKMVDIYVKSLDLFVECNFHWCHGGKFFNENDEDDLKRLDVLKARAEMKRKESPKRRNAYEIAIYTWTVLDKKKLKYAEDNQLRYLVFWKEDEAFEWLDAYKMKTDPSK